MNFIWKTNGHTARRWAINDSDNNGFSIDRACAGVITLIASVILAVLFAACDPRAESGNLDQEKKTASGDSIHKPKVNIRVDKHFDDKGNMIGFDSTYSSFYSNMEGDTIKMDSLINSFDQYFYNSHSSFLERQFDPLFFNDSTRYPDFFHKDFFLRRYELNDDYMRDMMGRMDSIKNKFFNEANPRHKKEGV